MKIFSSWNKVKCDILSDGYVISNSTKIVRVSGEDALQFLKKAGVDLIILDIMLPSIDGLEVCKLIKKNETLDHIPIIMLTARGEEIDQIVGFELGADDYVVKPFSPRELILRVKAILKRGKQKK